VAGAADCGAAQWGGRAILLVSFGTSVEQARQVYAAMEAAVRERFPGVPLRWAFTSKKIRQKLSQEGRPVSSPAQALANLAEDGFERVAVQSLHIVPGEEFEGLQETAQRFAGMPKGLKKVTLGQPLLSSPPDLRRVAQALLAHPPAERKPTEALVFMGHGTAHQANAAYPALAVILQEMDAHAFLGTVEASPDLASLQLALISRGVKKAWLIPLMSVAGDHAQHDMAGQESGSWASQLGQAGITCQPVLKGLAENPEVVAVWLDHLQQAWNQLGKE
jgi:sirohydrochlorin cobaltochelatase